MSKASAPLVSAQDMAKKYGDFIALHPLNVEVHSGEFFGVFGPNGAGKSTFIKLLTGQLRPSKGRIEVLGVDAVNDPQKVKANIGIVPESESPPSFLTPAEFLEFVARLRGVDDMLAKVEHWLDWFGLQDKRDTMCKDLSKGQRQKVCWPVPSFTNPNCCSWTNLLQISTQFISENAENGCSITWKKAGQFSSARTFLRWPNGCATAWPLSTTAESLQLERSRA